MVYDGTEYEYAGIVYDGIVYDGSVKEKPVLGVVVPVPVPPPVLVLVLGLVMSGWPSALAFLASATSKLRFWGMKSVAQNGMETSGENAAG